MKINTYKIVVLLMCIAFIITLCFAGCKAEAAEEAGGEGTTEGKVIGFAQVIYSNPFAKAAQDYFTQEANAYGMEVTAADADLDLDKMISDVETFIAQEVDLITFIPFDWEGSLTIVKSANEAGIPIIAYVNVAQPEEGVPLYAVNCDNYEMGVAQAEYFVDALPENANIVYMELEPGSEHSRSRRAGFMDTLKPARPDVTVLAEQYSYSARDKGLAIMEDWLQAFPDQIDAVITGNDESALGALQAIKAAGLEGQITVSGMDATQEALDEIEAGNCAVSVLQPAKELGKATADLAASILKGEKPPYETIVPPVAISKENLDEYIDYWK